MGPMFGYHHEDYNVLATTTQLNDIFALFQTTDQELKVFFSSYGAVKDTKIICDRAGVSKG